jgi:hypothetical protein
MVPLLTSLAKDTTSNTLYSCTSCKSRNELYFRMEEVLVNLKHDFFKKIDINKY